MSGRKVRNLKPLEVFYEMGQRFGVVIVGYKVTLRTSRELEDEVVHRAAHFLFMKVPSFRLCIREEDGIFSFEEMKESVVDVQIAEEETSTQEIMTEINHSPFNSARGPLWRMKFVRNQSLSTEPNPLFPFESHVFFGFHHAITDGYSNVKIIEMFTQILDNLLQKRPIEENQLGIFYLGEYSRDLLERRKRELEEDSRTYSEVKEEVMKSLLNTNTLWEDSFGFNENVENKTLYLSHTFSEEVSRNVRDKFKLHNVSLNSTICAVANVVITKMIREKGKYKDAIDVGTLHGVNMRQYWPKDEAINLGLHIGLMRIPIQNAPKDEVDFWKYAKRVHEIISKKVAEKWCLNEDIVQDSVFKTDGEYFRDLFTKENPPHTLLYAGSSLGNVDKSITSSRETVEWVSLERSTSVHLLGCPLGLNFHIFRNKISFSLIYVTKYVTEETAKSVMINLRNKICAVAQN